VGADVSVPDGAGDPVAALFAEEPSRVVASLPAASLAGLRARAESAGVSFVEIGKTTATELVIRRNGSMLVRASLEELRDARERCLVGIVGE
jgi:molybdate-binding protein